ncbi:MAG: tetratricopeptide repeat protein, partial [Tardiphaga sp.]
PFYEQAATLAKAAGKAGNRPAWYDYAVVVGNWAVALQHVGELERSLELQRERTSALKTAGASTISIISSELAAFRIDIDQGRAAEVLSEIERMVGQIERWWQQSQAGKKVAEAPDPEELEHMYLDALDIDRQARIAVEQWEVALRQTDAILAIRMALKYPIEDIAIYWRNRATILIELGRFGEAQTALQACLQVFTDDPINRARTLHTLADLFREQGDLQQAILQGRRAHALFDTLPSPDDRSASHNNLANYLRSSGQASAIAEAACHRLAALVYAVTADLGWRLENALHNYVFDSQESGQKVDPEPSLERLLADPAFHPLDVWLRQREVDIMEVQAVIREYLTALRNAQPD